MYYKYFESTHKHLHANGDKQPPAITNAQYTFMVQEKPNLVNVLFAFWKFKIRLYDMGISCICRIFWNVYGMVCRRYCFTCFMRWVEISRGFCRDIFECFLRMLCLFVRGLPVVSYVRLCVIHARSKYIYIYVTGTHIYRGI